jgi:hypothetical protein
MKGWRPSAGKGSSRIGLFVQRTQFLPDIGSIALSFPLLGPWTHDPGCGRRGSLTFRSAIRLAVGRSDNWRKRLRRNPRSQNGASPSLAFWDRGNRNEDKRNDEQPGRTSNARAAMARLMWKAAQKEKKALGVSVSH